jgi:broad specificity phosphatase PhoE
VKEIIEVPNEPTIHRPIQLIWIRHAESARNKAKRGTTYFADEEARKTVKGIPDNKIPITPFGVEQARQTGIYLRDRFGPPDYAYHSGYLRTEQTLEGALGAFSADVRRRINVRMNPFIRERDSGYTYDMTEKEAEAAFPWLREYWKTFGGFFARPVGGESLADVANRLYLFLNMLFRDRVQKKVWVCTHGGTMRVVRFLLERWSYDQGLSWPAGQSPKNCGITVYEYDKDEGRLVLREYNTVC